MFIIYIYCKYCYNLVVCSIGIWGSRRGIFIPKNINILLLLITFKVVLKLRIWLRMLWPRAQDHVLKYVHFPSNRVEDHDDLVPIFNRQSDMLQKTYGDYFLAELIEAQDDTMKCIVAEVREILPLCPVHILVRSIVL